jgi:hypothetical protein
MIAFAMFFIEQISLDGETMNTKSPVVRRAIAPAADASPKPLGIGTGVAFDWALAGQMVGMAFLLGVLGLPGSEAHGAERVLLTLGYLLVAPLPMIIGEGLRSGRQWAWWIQVVLCGALSLGGLVIIPGTIHSLQHHNGWPLYTQIILIGLCPLIFIRMLHPQTRAWFASVTVAAARARHNAPLWLASIIAFAAIGGFMVAVERLFD